MLARMLNGGNLNISYFRLSMGKWSNLTSIFFKWPASCNKRNTHECIRGPPQSHDPSKVRPQRCTEIQLPPVGGSLESVLRVSHCQQGIQLICFSKSQFRFFDPSRLPITWFWHVHFPTEKTHSKKSNIPVCPGRKLRAQEHCPDPVNACSLHLWVFRRWPAKPHHRKLWTSSSRSWLPSSRKTVRKNEQIFQKALTKYNTSALEADKLYISQSLEETPAWVQPLAALIRAGALNALLKAHDAPEEVDSATHWKGKAKKWALKRRTVLIMSSGSSSGLLTPRLWRNILTSACLRLWSSWQGKRLLTWGGTSWSINPTSKKFRLRSGLWKTVSSAPSFQVVHRSSCQRSLMEVPGSWLRMIPLTAMFNLRDRKIAHSDSCAAACSQPWKCWILLPVGRWLKLPARSLEHVSQCVSRGFAVNTFPRRVASVGVRCC